LSTFSKSGQTNLTFGMSFWRILLNILIEEIPISTINEYVLQTTRLNSQALLPSKIHKPKYIFLTPLLHIIEQYNQLNCHKEDEKLLGDRVEERIL
jgi:hypothetical protein